MKEFLNGRYNTAEKLMNDMIDMIPPCFGPERLIHKANGNPNWRYFPKARYSFVAGLYRYMEEPYLWLSLGLTDISRTDPLVLRLGMLLNEDLAEPFRIGIQKNVLTLCLRINAARVDPLYLESLVENFVPIGHEVFVDLQKEIPSLRPLMVQLKEEDLVPKVC